MNSPTLALLQADARRQIFEPVAFSRACASPRSPSDDEIRCCDALVQESARWLAKHQPRRYGDRRDEHHRQKFERWLTRRAERGKVTIVSSESKLESYGGAMFESRAVCGIGLILGALLSWMVGKVIDWIWNWWRRTEKAPEFCRAMVADLPGLDDDDDD